MALLEFGGGSGGGGADFSPLTVDVQDSTPLQLLPSTCHEIGRDWEEDEAAMLRLAVVCRTNRRGAADSGWQVEPGCLGMT